MLHFVVKLTLTKCSELKIWGTQIFPAAAAVISDAVSYDCWIRFIEFCQNVVMLLFDAVNALA